MLRPDPRSATGDAAGRQSPLSSGSLTAESACSCRCDMDLLSRLVDHPVTNALGATFGDTHGETKEGRCTVCNDPLLPLILAGACSTSCRWGIWLRPGCIDQLLEAQVWGGVRTGDAAYGGRSRTGRRGQFGRPRRAPVRKRHGDSPCSSRDAAPFSFPLDRCPSLYSMSPPVEVYLHSSPTAPKIQGIGVTTTSHCAGRCWR